MTAQNLILLIEPDQKFFEFIREVLETEGYLVIRTKDALDVENLIENNLPKLVIISQNLKNLIPNEVVNKIRTNFSSIPVLMIMDEPNVDMLVRAYKLGLNDYIVKPFSLEDFIARVEILLLGLQQQKKQILKVADLSFDKNTLEVIRSGQTIDLTPREKALLRFLLRNKNRVLSREVILSRVWEYPTDVDSRAVDVYIGYLRSKIDNNFKNKLLHTVRGFGYMIADKKL